jgi:DNA-binding PadR family transcriptional regulator
MPIVADHLWRGPTSINRLNLLQIVSEASTPMTMLDCSHLSGLKKSYTGGALDNLADQGCLERVAPGTFIITERGKEALLRRKEISCDVPLTRYSKIRVRSEIRKNILDLLEKKGEQTIDVLAKDLQASFETIRRGMVGMIDLCLVGVGTEFGVYKITERGRQELLGQSIKRAPSYKDPGQVGLPLQLKILGTLYSCSPKTLNKKDLGECLKKRNATYNSDYYVQALKYMTQKGYLEVEVATTGNRRSYGISSEGMSRLNWLMTTDVLNNHNKDPNWQLELRKILGSREGLWSVMELRHALRRVGHCVDRCSIKRFLRQLVGQREMSKEGRGSYLLLGGAGCQG